VGEVEGLGELVEGSCGKAICLVGVGEDVVPYGLGVAVRKGGAFLEKGVFGELGFDEGPGMSSIVGEKSVGEGCGGLGLEVVPALGWSG
jgi:hypothetical protein